MIPSCPTPGRGVPEMARPLTADAQVQAEVDRVLAGLDLSDPEDLERGLLRLRGLLDAQQGRLAALMRAGCPVTPLGVLVRSTALTRVALVLVLHREDPDPAVIAGLIDEADAYLAELDRRTICTGS